MTDKAIIYKRVSGMEQNPELQDEECKKFCKQKDWEVVDVLEERESAFKDDNKREKFQEMIKRAERGEFQHIVVWNMDRFSRQPEEEVLKLVRKLNLYGVDVVAVKGDLWSDLVQSVGKIKEMGFIGEAISEFLEKIIKGLEFQRAHRESQVKSERVKLAVRKEEGQKAKSYKGNKWGRKSLNQSVIEKIKQLRNEGKSITQICKEVSYWDKNNNKKFVSRAVVHKLIHQIG